jgi:hypothetical protein
MPAADISHARLDRHHTSIGLQRQDTLVKQSAIQGTSQRKLLYCSQPRTITSLSSPPGDELTWVVAAHRREEEALGLGQPKLESWRRWISERASRGFRQRVIALSPHGEEAMSEIVSMIIHRACALALTPQLPGGISHTGRGSRHQR